jgi:hypothetical protein
MASKTGVPALQPVKTGFVSRQEDWLYSSAVDYNGGKWKGFIGNNVVWILRLDRLYRKAQVR